MERKRTTKTRSKLRKNEYYEKYLYDKFFRDSRNPDVQDVLKSELNGFSVAIGKYDQNRILNGFLNDND